MPQKKWDEKVKDPIFRNKNRPIAFKGRKNVAANMPLKSFEFCKYIKSPKKTPIRDAMYTNQIINLDLRLSSSSLTYLWGIKYSPSCLIFIIYLSGVNESL
jgi:hypothetical protein